MDTSADRHEKIVYPQLSDDLKGGLGWRSLKYFGAGAIMASVTIGSGETLFASRAGAIFGYALLWCFVGGAIMKGIQVYVGARHMTLTGEHPMTHWGQMPGPKHWVPWMFAGISLLCFPFWIAGLPSFLGTAINWMLGLENKVLFSTGAPGTDGGINIDLVRVWGAAPRLERTRRSPGCGPGSCRSSHR